MHDFDPNISHADLCELQGICPGCHSELDWCSCEEDFAIEAEAASHPAGCACCADEAETTPVVMTAAELADDNAFVAAQLENAFRAVSNPEFDRAMAHGLLASAVERALQALRGTRDAQIHAELDAFRMAS